MLTRYYIKKRLVKENKIRKRERAFKALQIAMIPSIAYSQVCAISMQYGNHPASKAIAIAEVCLNMARSVIDICNNKTDNLFAIESAGQVISENQNVSQ